MKFNLKDLQNKKQLCEIYTNDSDTGKFSVGYIIFYDKHWCCIQSFNQYGKQDGTILVSIEDIIRIQTCTTYLKNIEKLINYYGKQKDAELLKLKEGDVFDSYCDFLLINKKICSIEICNSNVNDLHGIIEKNFDLGLEIKIIDENGKIDGFSTIEKMAVTSMSSGSEEEKMLEILYNINEK